MIRRLVRFADLAAICFLYHASAALCGAQSQLKPAVTFEVASIKPLDRSLQPGEYDLSFVGTSGKPFKITGNRVSVRGTLRTLIADAYGIKDYQISELPSWADSLMYAVSAIAPGEAAPPQDAVRPMLQALIAERCQLKFHHETKELRVYHLVEAKKSTLFKAASPEEAFSWNITPGPAGTLRSKATKESIGDFVQLVGVSTDRPVIDKTGITGDIDYDILITPPASRTPEETNRAIVYAVVDQLGLKLESAKDPIDMLVVDGVEKPSAD